MGFSPNRRKDDAPPEALHGDALAPTPDYGLRRKTIGPSLRERPISLRQVGELRDGQARENASLQIAGHFEAEFTVDNSRLVEHVFHLVVGLATHFDLIVVFGNLVDNCADRGLDHGIFAVRQGIEDAVLIVVILTGLIHQVCVIVVVAGAERVIGILRSIDARKLGSEPRPLDFVADGVDRDGGQRHIEQRGGDPGSQRRAAYIVASVPVRTVIDAVIKVVVAVTDPDHPVADRQGVDPMAEIMVAMVMVRNRTMARFQIRARIDRRTVARCAMDDSRTVAAGTVVAGNRGTVVRPWSAGHLAAAAGSARDGGAVV